MPIRRIGLRCMSNLNDRIPSEFGDAFSSAFGLDSSPCSAALTDSHSGLIESVETLPEGSHLTFDPSRGRVNHDLPAPDS